jgi:hypothetical protein
MAKWTAKDPSDIADYFWDWGSTSIVAAERFLPESTTITAHTVTVPAGITKVSDSHTDKTVRVRVSGGTAGTNYGLTCLITCSDGQVFESTKTLQVVERVR